MWKHRVAYVLAVICGIIATPFLMFLLGQMEFLVILVLAFFFLILRGRVSRRVPANIGAAFFLSTLITQIIFYILLLLAMLSMLGSGA